MMKEKSGSCACVIMIIDDTVFVANVGDSRSIMSMYSIKFYLIGTSDNKVALFLGITNPVMRRKRKE